MYTQNNKNMDFDLPKIVAKNTLIYKTFNKKSWDYKAKEYGYQYINQILEN